MWISDKSAFRIPFTINIIKFNDHFLLTLNENQNPFIPVSSSNY